MSDNLSAKNKALLELQQCKQAVKFWAADDRKKDAHPVRWMVKTLFHENVGRVIGAVVVVALIAWVWSRFRPS